MNSQATPLLIWAYLLSAGLVLFPGVQALWAAMLGQRRHLHLAFAAMCLSGAAFQLTQVMYYAAADVDAAVAALRWQYESVGVFLVAFVAFTGIFTKARRWPAIVLGAGAVITCLLIANRLLPYGMRFDFLQPAPPILMPWGERLTHFSGTVGWPNLITRAVVIGIFAWGLWRALLEFRKGRRRMAALLSSCVLLMIAGVTWGTLIDLGSLDSFYVSGFAYVALALFMGFEMALELRNRSLELVATSADLSAEIERRRKSDRAISHLAAGVATETGDRFFQRLSLELAQLFAAEWSFIAMVDARRPEKARSLAICEGGKPRENRDFDLRLCAWGNAYGGKPLVIDRGAKAAFPADVLLRESGIESLIAMPLFDTAGAASGVIVVMHRECMDDPARVLEILEIVGARAAAEIQRINDEADIRRLAYQDHLTGLANRARFQSYLEDALASARRQRGYGAILLVDLDHFKTINDALSHDVGDQVLIDVAQRLRRCAPACFIARLGGDEFVVALQDLHADASGASAAIGMLAQSVIDALAEPLFVRGHALNVRASIGIAPFPYQDSSALDALRQADLALYRAKQKGRGLVQFYEAAMQVSAAERLNLEKGLRQAMADSQLELHFQPQVNAAGAMVGVEALVRWEHADLGAIPPSTFIAVAEEAGLIHELGNWVFERACGRLAQWQLQRQPIRGRLSINISPWQFTRPDFLSQIKEMLARYAISPSALTVEITESALLYDVNDAIQKLHALRAMGFVVALDDFGTGYSSLAYLRDLPLDELKIDRTFVNDLHSGSNAALVQSMISVARHMGLHAIAEGVESAEQRDALIAMGCNSFQGFLFGRPLPESQFLSWASHNARLYPPASKTDRS